MKKVKFKNSILSSENFIFHFGRIRLKDIKYFCESISLILPSLYQLNIFFVVLLAVGLLVWMRHVVI